MRARFWRRTWPDVKREEAWIEIPPMYALRSFTPPFTIVTTLVIFFRNNLSAFSSLLPLRCFIVMM
jgi:hypothetical protein